jgi:hypothetical protein
MADRMLAELGPLGPSGRARVGYMYGRIGAALAVGGLLASMLGAGPAVAADPLSDVVLDAVVTVHQVDPDEGPIGGATITITAYRDGGVPIQAKTATTDANGDATLVGVARPASAASALLLDVRSDKSSAIVDANGCTQTSSWSAARDALAAAAVVDVVLDTTAKSASIDCPQPSGEVLGATGLPEITPPSTDVCLTEPARGGHPMLPALLVIFAMALVALPLRTLATAPMRRRRRGR